MSALFRARSLSFAYDRAEDRLILIAKGQDEAQRGLLLTRRMTSLLLNGLAGLLERSSAKAARAPTEMREDVVLLEHREALEEVSAQAGGKLSPGPGAARAMGGKKTVRLDSRLVTSVDIANRPIHFEITMKAGKEALLRLDIKRKELHRMLQMISAKAEGAEWNIRIEAGWLDTGQTALTLN